MRSLLRPKKYVVYRELKTRYMELLRPDERVTEQADAKIPVMPSKMEKGDEGALEDHGKIAEKISSF